MSLDPTPKQTLILLDLALKNRACGLSELPKHKGGERKPLMEARFVAETKIGRNTRLSLDDAGWAWLGGHLTAKLPRGNARLTAIMLKLDALLRETGKGFADFIGPAEPERSKSASTKKAPAKHSRPKGSGAQKDVVQQIEAAYLKVTGGRRDEQAPLARIRAELGRLDRASVDAALKHILSTGGKITLMRNDDPSRLTAEDRAAEFNPYGEPFHGLWIAS